MYSHIPRLTERIQEAFAASSAGMKAAHGTRPMHAGAIRNGGATPPVPAPIKTFEEHQSGASGTAKSGGTGPSYRASPSQPSVGPHVVPDELERLAGEEVDRMMANVSAQRFAGARQIREQRISLAYEDGQSIQRPTLSSEERQLFEARHQPQTSAHGAVPQEQGFWQGRVEDFEQLKESTLNIFATAPGGTADVLATGVVGAAQLYQTGTNLGLVGIVGHLQRFDELNEAQLRRLDTNIRILGFFGRDEEAHLARSTFARLWDGTLSPADVPVGELLAGTEDYTFLLDLMQQANDFRAGVHAAFPPRPGFEDHLTTDIGRGLGAVSVYLATMALPGSQARFVAGNALGILESQGAMVERAMADGATRDQVAVAAAMATIPGLTEMLPLEYLIRMPALRNGLLRSLAEAGRQGLLEGGQEALQTVMHNAIVQLVYDEDQDLLEGAVESSEAGAGVGLTLGMMQQFAGGLIGARIREPRTVTLGGERVEIQPGFLDGITDSGDLFFHSPVSTAIGEDPGTTRTFQSATDTGRGHTAIVHGSLLYNGELPGMTAIVGYDELSGREYLKHHIGIGHVAEAILSNPDYVHGSPICFASCWSASSGTAQDLADYTGSPINAPTRPIIWDSDRNDWSFDTEMDGPTAELYPEIVAGWDLFNPRGELDE